MIAQPEVSEPQLRACARQAGRRVQPGARARPKVGIIRPHMELGRAGEEAVKDLVEHLEAN